MKVDHLQQYVRLRRELAEEKASLEARLKEINDAIGEVPLPSPAPLAGAAGQGVAEVPTRGRRPTGGGQSLREHVIAILEEGRKTKEEILEAVRRRGYKFSTANPLNSLGVILYGKNPKLERAEGKFSIGNVAVPAKKSRNGKRRMSAGARARIAEAQRKRWEQVKGRSANLSNESGTNKRGGRRRMSAAGRAAIADAARKRWAAAKAAGRRTL